VLEDRFAGDGGLGAESEAAEDRAVFKRKDSCMSRGHQGATKSPFIPRAKVLWRGGKSGRNHLPTDVARVAWASCLARVHGQDARATLLASGARQTPPSIGRCAPRTTEPGESDGTITILPKPQKRRVLASGVLWEMLTASSRSRLLPSTIKQPKPLCVPAERRGEPERRAAQAARLGRTAVGNHRQGHFSVQARQLTSQAKGRAIFWNAKPASSRLSSSSGPPSRDATGGSTRQPP